MHLKSNIAKNLCGHIDNARPNVAKPVELWELNAANLYL